MVTLIFASWNQIADWLRRMEGLRRAAGRSYSCDTSASDN
jgi:hypothetical protein